MNLEPYIKQAEQRRQKVEKEISDFDFSASGNDGLNNYQNLNREYQRLNELLKLWGELERVSRQLEENRQLLNQEEEDDMLSMVQAELESLEKEYHRLQRQVKTLILPPASNEDRNSIVEIRPAAGGDEAGLFANDLFRMYSRFAESKGWKLEVLELIENAVGGLKTAVFSLQGEQVYRYMGFESGVHRVQRVPETETSGRIHTSTVTVAVLPEAREVDVQIKNEDLRIDVFRASGPGGQSVNTTDSAVRVTHLPTGITVSSQNEKSQHRNKNTAMRILRSRLLEKKQAEEAEKSAAQRRSQVGTGDRSERIRTYNFPQSRLTDHRYGITRHDLHLILEGQLGELLEELISCDVEQRLKEELESGP